MKTGICILAGGLSTRMGRDKGGMRLGGRTLCGHLKHLAESLEMDVRIIRKDVIPRCGPLGGIYTGLKTSPHDAEIFLSCDMPFIRPSLLRKLARKKPPTVVEYAGRIGFPLMLSSAHLEVIETEIRAGRLSLQNLAKTLKAKCMRVGGREARQLFNINTLADWREAQRRLSELPL